MSVVFRKMCDKCFRMVGDNEQLFGLKLVDDEDAERVYKGHKECMDELIIILGQLYGQPKEQDENDNR